MKPLELLHKAIILTFLPIILFGCNSKNEKGTEENQGQYVFRDNSYTNQTDFKFKTKNDTFESAIELIALNDTVFNFTFFYKDLKNNDNMNLKGLMKNIDSNADFDESDPNGNGEPTQIFEFLTDSVKIEMAIPYSAPTIVGICIENYRLRNCNFKILEFKLMR